MYVGAWTRVGSGNWAATGWRLGLMGQVRLTEGRAYALRVSFGPTNLASQNGSKTTILVDLWKKGKNASKTRRNPPWLFWKREKMHQKWPNHAEICMIYVVRYKFFGRFGQKISQISDLIWDCRCPSGKLVQKSLFWPDLKKGPKIKPPMDFYFHHSCWNDPKWPKNDQKIIKKWSKNDFFEIKNRLEIRSKMAKKGQKKWKKGVKKWSKRGPKMCQKWHFFGPPKMAFFRVFQKVKIGGLFPEECPMAIFEFGQIWMTLKKVSKSNSKKGVQKNHQKMKKNHDFAFSGGGGFRGFWALFQSTHLRK